MNQAIRRFQVVKGPFKGQYGEGLYYQDHLLLCLPSVDQCQTTEKFHRSQAIPCGSLPKNKQGITLKKFLGRVPLVNVSYFPNKLPQCRIEGERVDYLEIKQNVIKLHKIHQKDTRANNEGTPRGNITGFSDSSRSRMIRMMASLERYPNVWQDFTFPDDVMKGLSITEKSVYTSMVLKKMKRTIQKIYPDFTGIWRREWEDRKSGDLKGHYVPHFHVLIDMPDITEKNYIEHCLVLAEKWVEHTGTVHPKALAVAMSSKSYRYLKTKKMAQCYVSKYIAKGAEMEIDETDSLGRFWGFIGKPAMGETEFELLTDSEEKLLRRILRKYCHRKRMENLLKSESGFWILIGRSTIKRIILHVKEINKNRCLEEPFFNTKGEFQWTS